MTTIKLETFLDVKDFRKLMDKHEIVFLNVTESNGFVFKVTLSEADLENILTATLMEWSFV